MIYYIYYGYITGYTLYTMHSYWELAKTSYKVYSDVSEKITGVYKWVNPEEIELDIIDDTKEWDLCE